MKANELRIGNLVYEVSDTPDNCFYEEIFHISSINEKYQTLQDIDENITSIDYCKPIPLTEEILLKFGAVFDSIFYNIENERWKFSLTQSRNSKTENLAWMCIIHKKGDDDGNISLYVKYVHKLQNLYFALTGVELKYIE